MRLVATTLLAVMLSAACVQASEPPQDELGAAYWRILDLRRCLLLDPNLDHNLVVAELDRTDVIMLRAGSKGLDEQLFEDASEWRAFDATADKACYFQMAGGSESGANLLREANDALELAVDQE